MPTAGNGRRSVCWKRSFMALHYTNRAPAQSPSARGLVPVFLARLPLVAARLGGLAARHEHLGDRVWIRAGGEAACIPVDLDLRDAGGWRRPIFGRLPRGRRAHPL